MDSTAIFSRSANISILELGHNTHDIHIPQINLMMLFSSTRTMPTFMRILPGSIRDVSAMANTVDMAGVGKCVIIAEKGFYSLDNLKELRKRHLSFIIPMRRNSSLIPDAGEFSGVFMYDGRPMKYWRPMEGLCFHAQTILSASRNTLLQKRSKLGSLSLLQTLRYLGKLRAIV